MNDKTAASFQILEETADWLVVNKTGDLVCHPTKGDAYSSLIGRLRLYFDGQPEVKPGFVNRLDRETSGVMLVAKNPKVHASFQRAFRKGRVEKVYLAIVHGVPAESSGQINQPLGREPGAEIVIRQAIQTDGAPSVTAWHRLKSSGRFSLLEVRPTTGRLHQIRVHLASIGHAVVGDKLYGPDPRFYLEFIQTGWTASLEKRLFVPRQMLHASELRITRSDGEVLGHWKAPLPEDMRKFLEKHFPGGGGAEQPGE